MASQAKKVIFTGRVQGVGFRYSTDRIANKYAVTGYVKNLPTGQVEMLIQGNAPTVKSCIEEVKQYFDGYIRDTKINDVPADHAIYDFKVAF
jgi:acylphosphatase